MSESTEQAIQIRPWWPLKAEKGRYSVLSPANNCLRRGEAELRVYQDRWSFDQQSYSDLALLANMLFRALQTTVLGKAKPSCVYISIKDKWPFAQQAIWICPWWPLKAKKAEILF